MQNDITDAKFLCGDFRLSMWIPSDIAGKVIGKKGIVISNMQRETGCKVITACQPVGDSLWVCVTMIGEPTATMKAYSAIEKIALEVDEVVAEFSLHKTKHAFLMGKGSLAVIKKISADTNVRVFIPGPDNSSSGFMPNGMQKSNASLEGTFENVLRAFEMLEQQYKNPPAAPAKVEKAKDAPPISSPTKAPRGEKAPKESAQKESAPKVEERDKTPRVPQVKVEKRIEIPASIVGILLVRRDAEKQTSVLKQISVLNQIQKSTGTSVSRLTTPGASRRGAAVPVVESMPAAASPTVESAEEAVGRVATDDRAAATVEEKGEEEGVSGRRRKDASDDEEEDEDEEDDEEEDDEEEPGPATEADTSASEVAEILANMAVTPAQLPPVPFVIVGFSQADVDKAEECIARIVAGERIKEVLLSVSGYLRGQPREAEPVNSRAKLMFGSKEGRKGSAKGKKGPGKQQVEGVVAAGAVGAAGAAASSGPGKLKAKKHKPLQVEKGTGSKPETPELA